jgi:FAD-linked sulfhydryl oxidase
MRDIMARRQHVTLMFAAAVIMLIGLSYLLSSSGSSLPGITTKDDAAEDLGPKDFAQLSESTLFGESIAPKLENATLKYALPPPPSALHLAPYPL